MVLFNHRCKKNEAFSFKVDLGRFKNKKNRKRRKNKNSAKNTVTNWKILGTILDRETNMLHDFYLPELSADSFEIHKSESWEIHLTVSPTSPVTQAPLTIVSGFPVTNMLIQTLFVSVILASSYLLQKNSWPAHSALTQRVSCKPFDIIQITSDFAG